MGSAFPRDELQALAETACNGELTPRDVERLEQLLAGNADAQQFYLKQVRLDACLRWEFAGGLEESAPPAAPAAPVSAPTSVPFFSTLSASLLTPGGLLFSYVVAAALLGIATLLGALYKVSPPSVPMAVAPAPFPAKDRPTPMPRKEVIAVARVTDMVQVVWADRTLAPSVKRVFLGNKFALASGLMEITYDTGARVVLEGPCTYTVESRSGGFLEWGRLTARVDKGIGGGGRGAGNELAQSPNQESNIKNQKSPGPLFSIRTPTAVVNDIGTEFGVEVDEHNGSCVHVFVGAVDLAPVDRLSGGVRINKGEAGRISGAQGAAIEKIGMDSSRFVRPRAMLAGTLERNPVLFRDRFKTFAMGALWRAGSHGSPDILSMVSQDGRPALRMKNSPAANSNIIRSLETVESFSLQGLAAIQLDVVFRRSSVAPPRIEVWLSGSSRKMVRMVESANYVNFSADSCEGIHRQLGAQWSPKNACRNGERYRCILSVDGRCARLTMKDDINLSVVHKAQFDNFSLADLGDDVRVVLVLFTEPNQTGECWIYEAMLSGRLGARRYPSSKDVPETTLKPSPVKPHDALQMKGKEAAKQASR
jgi:hypothetical protein